MLQVAKRHKLDVDANNGASERDLLKHVNRMDESGLCRFLIELILLDSAYRLPAKDTEDVLIQFAQRYRVDTPKVEKETAQKVAAQQKKREQSKNIESKKAIA